MKSNLKQKMQGIKGNTIQTWKYSDWMHEDLRHHIIRSLLTLGHQIDAEIFDYHVAITFKNVQNGIAWEIEKIKQNEGGK